MVWFMASVTNGGNTQITLNIINVLNKTISMAKLYVNTMKMRDICFLLWDVGYLINKQDYFEVTDVQITALVKSV